MSNSSFLILFIAFIAFMGVVPFLMRRLGLLLFGWVGLLMGLLGAGKVDLVCRNCGTQWEAGNPQNRRSTGCFTLLFIVVFIMLLAAAL